MADVFELTPERIKLLHSILRHIDTDMPHEFEFSMTEDKKLKLTATETYGKNGYGARTVMVQDLKLPVLA